MVIELRETKRSVGILLAGGLSRRYGSPKAFAEINGRKFYEISYDILNALCDDVIIVTRQELIHKFPKDKHIIVDKPPYSGCGPLAGIYSAMVTKKADRYVVLPCDMPLITEEVIRKLLQRHEKDVTVTVVEGRLQPLVSVWNGDVLEKIKQTLENKHYKMTEVLKTTDVEYVEASELTSSLYLFMNVNTLEDEKEARKWVLS